MLKATQPEKKQPATPKHLNGNNDGTRESVSKDNSRTHSEARQTNAGKVKPKTVSRGAVKKHPGVDPGAPAAVATAGSTGPKRKSDSGESKSEAKKNKPVVEKAKPSE